MEKIYNKDSNTLIYSTGKDIEDVLHTLKIPCAFLEGSASPYSNVYYYKLKDAMAITKLPKIIPALEVLFSVESGAITYSPTPQHLTAHFCLTVETSNRTPLSLKAYETEIKGKDNTLMLGVDIATGELIYTDLLTTPHLLIAGASGSGKSVLLHNLIASLCKYNTHNNTAVVLIDTKQVEFAEYENKEFSEFLGGEICYDVKSALWTLRTICEKMDERFAKMKEKGLKVYDGTKWVIVIDEFADLMLMNKRQIEPLIVRIAQMGRACGVHLIIATQRPSVDVCTGLIKANIPDRIALRCASIKDSLVILDKKGAETLKGKGEALVRIGNNPKKIQCFDK